MRKGVCDSALSRRDGHGAQARGLRGEEARRHGREDDLGGEVVDLGDVEAAVEAGDLGVVPADGEGNRRGAEDGEVVGVMRVLPDVVGGEDGVARERLLEAGVKVVAEAGAVRRGRAGDERGDDRGSSNLRRRG